MYTLRSLIVVFSRSLDNAVQLICLTLSLESFKCLPISSYDLGVSPCRPKCNFSTVISLSHSPWRSFSTSLFMNRFFTITSGVISSGPAVISCKIYISKCLWKNYHHTLMKYSGSVDVTRLINFEGSKIYTKKQI